MFNIIGFGQPMAFFGLLCVPLIIVMYMFKRRYVEVVVPSLMLWEQAARTSESNRSIQKLKKNLLLFLQILITCLAVLALSKPYIKGGEVSEYIIVLDCTMSMRAQEPSRMSLAKDEARKIINSMEQGGTSAIVVLSAEPYIAAAVSDDKNALLRKLETIEATYRTGDPEKVKGLIRGINDDATVVLISDKVQDIWEDVVYIPVGETLTNFAVTTLSYAESGEGLTVYARVRGFCAEEAVERSLALYADGEIFDIAAVTVYPGEDAEVYFYEVPAYAETVTAELLETDGMAEDNSRFLSVESTEKRKVILFTEQNVFLENAFGILPDITLYTGSKEDLAKGGLNGYGLYVFDGMLPAELPSDGHILVFNPPESEGGFLKTDGEFDVKTVTSVNTGLLSFINSPDFAVYKSKNVELPGWGEVILESEGIPIAFFGVTGENAGQKAVVMGFDLHNTDLPLKWEFPVFIYNLVSYFLPRSEIRNSDIYPGGVIEFNLLPESFAVSVTAPGGEKYVLAPPFPVKAFTGADEPGIYRLFRETPEGTVSSAFTVNYRDFEESDLFADGEGGSGDFEKNASKPGTGLEFGHFILILALIAAVLEWWVFYRGI